MSKNFYAATLPHYKGSKNATNNKIFYNFFAMYFLLLLSCGAEATPILTAKAFHLHNPHTA